MTKTLTPLESYLTGLGLMKFISGIPIKFGAPLLGYKLSADVKAHPYYEVYCSSWDKEPQEAFEKGEIILFHKFHSISLNMTISQFEKYIKHPDTVIYNDFMDWCRAENKIEEEYQKRSDDIEKTKILAPGYIFSSPVADGCAQYIVTKVTKVSVFFEHLGFGDGYQDQVINSFNGKLSRKQFDRITAFGRNSIFGAVRSEY